MQLNFDELKYVIGNAETIEQMVYAPPLPLFCDEVISFLNDLSKLIIKNGRTYSDVATFGFWCRKAALIQEKAKYDDISERLGRGIVFHSTPSNVPVNFAFSFAAGLLAGNANIVRLPAKDFEQVNIICNTIKELLNNNYKKLQPYLCMVKYPSVKEISDIFSLICDSRIIWGGDETIKNLRRSPLKARANEITFADRYSIAIINADEYLKDKDKTRIIQDFYNDTYFSDQNACTTPVLIIWTGKEKNNAKKEFWALLHKLVKAKYSMKAVQSIGKLNAFYKVASDYDVKLIKNDDFLITRIAIDKLDDKIMDFKYNSGFFFEYDIKNLEEIIPAVSNSKCQTITYYGISREELKNFLQRYCPKGVDRIVPVGKSMDFNLVWDGYDLIRSLSRKITII